MEEIKSFSEVEPEREAIYPDSERMDSSELLGKEIIVKEAQFLPSKFGGDFAVILFDLDGKEYSTTIGSKVVVERLKRNLDKLPLKGIYKEVKSKEGRMYQVIE